MRNRTTLAAALLALAALTTGCSSDSNDDPPAAATTSPAAAATTEAAAFGPEDRQACVDAWAETISNRPAGFDPDTDSDAEPDACAGIPGDDWLDAYMDGLQQSNETGRNEIDECLEDPSCTSIPIG